jgi:hypothetical protein
MTTTVHDTQATASTALDLPSAAEILKIMDRNQQNQEADVQKRHAAVEGEKKHTREIFLARNLTPDFIKQLISRVRLAAGSGAMQIMVIQFPSEWCTDQGRMINATEDGWAATLPGISGEFFTFWQRDLKPRGFHLRAAIISFPNGMPGDVGVFLSWEG